MAYVFLHARCAECGSTHHLFVPDGYPMARDAIYTFACPSTRRTQAFEPWRLPIPFRSLPVGSVPINGVAII